MKLFAKKTKTQETRSEAIDNYSTAIGQILGCDTDMSAEKALRICTVNACVRVIANAFSTLPINTYRKLPNGGRELAEELPLYWLLKYQPNEDQDACQFKEQIILGLLLYGNGYVQISRNKSGIINELYALDPKITKKQKDLNGKTYYTTTTNNIPLTLPKSDVMHVTSLGGRNPISLVSDTLRDMEEMQKRNVNFWENGANPSGVLKYAGKVTQQMLKNIRESWNQTYTGAPNAGKTLILEQGMDFQPITVTQQQAQYIESLKLDGNQICGMFSVPPHKVGFLDNATYSNIEEQNISFVTDCLQPIIIRVETAMMSSFLSESEVKKYKFEFNLDSQLRGRALERSQKLQIERQNGVLSIDEWRALENRNPLPDNLGDIYQVPMNMDTLGDGIEPDPNNPKNPPSVFGLQGVNPSEPTDNTAPEAKSVFLPIIERAIEQTLRRENKMKDEKRNSKEEEAFVFDTFKPIFDGVSALSKKEFSKRDIEGFASEWVGMTKNWQNGLEERKELIFKYMEG